MLMAKLRAAVAFGGILGLLMGNVSQAKAQAGRAILTNISKGETLPDTGLDTETKPRMVQQPKLGGKALLVEFAAGDSVGQRAKVTDWSKFARVRFDVLNEGSDTTLELNLAHAGSKNYETRVVIPITVPSGKTEVSVPLEGLKNVDGSDPDLAHMVRWYLADVNGEAPKLAFGDIALETEDYKPGAAAPATVLKPGLIHGDPKRVARIRAAKMPAIKGPLMFDTPEADAILSALEIYPEDNPFNLIVDRWPVHPDSKAIVAAIGADKPLRYNPDMGFMLVPPNQKRVAVNEVEYADESDPGPFPIPDNLPIEGWPAYYKRENPSYTLADLQRDKLGEDGDRHACVVDPVNRIAYEFYQMKRTPNGWKATQTSIFDLKTNKLRPDTWTSTDAAGLPLFPAVVRYDELKRGVIDHALRVTVPRSRKSYVYPATHQAGHGDDSDLPRMGERLRLKANVDISKFSPEVKTILQALKTYGMIVADNGIQWAISVTPDTRIPVLHDQLRKIKGSDFEVITPPEGYEPPSGDDAPPDATGAVEY